LGNLNINTSKVNRNPVGTRFRNTLISYGVSHLITKPTRVTESRATIIDHIVTNDFLYDIYPSI